MSSKLIEWGVMPNYIYRLPNIFIMLLMILLISIMCIYVPELIHTFSIFHPTQESIRLGQALFSPIASSTGLLIGFLLNQAQSSYREVEGIVATEAGRINNLDRLLLRFGSQQALDMRIKLQQYIESIIGDEWPDLQNGRGSNKTHLLWREISQGVFKLEPITPKQLSLYGDIIDKQEDIAESRELRIDRSTKCLPTIFWIVIFICLASLTAINTLFMPDEQFTFGLTILPIAFGALISLLVVSDRPFKGQNGITPEALEKILPSIKTRIE
jgi:hypothetical protein